MGVTKSLISFSEQTDKDPRKHNDHRTSPPRRRERRSIVQSVAGCSIRQIVSVSLNVNIAPSSLSLSDQGSTDLHRISVSVFRWWRGQLAKVMELRMNERRKEKVMKWKTRIISSFSPISTTRVERKSYVERQESSPHSLHFHHPGRKKKVMR